MIELRGLGKQYRSLLRRRAVRALDDLTLTVERGEVLGIAGPNGAGKSTLLSLLLGFLRPTAGSVRIADREPRAYVEAHGVAYLPEAPALPPRWTVEATLRRSAALGGLPPAAARERAAAALAELELEGVRARPLRQLSKGTLQRVGLAQVLVAGSELVVLDEPTHGLDPLWTRRFRDLVRTLRHPTRAILVASHNLDELERIADRVAIFHQGRLERVVARGGASHVGDYRLVLAAAEPAPAELFPDARPVTGRPGEFRVRGEPAELSRRLGALIARGAVVLAFHPEESRLEAEFRAAVGEG
ncbi:MAG TPA: ABC transporter ATP-binding protein [Gemmatimonadales bacterium]|nr:ABC transporter ATP-binding protein [Gemmatimonadales bacterium]